MAKRENYNDLYLFMLVVREGSFTAAAQRLGLAQSGVSRAVRELEERLGYSFWCVPPVNSLTQAGEQLYRTVESGFDALDSGLSTLAYYRNTPPVPSASMPASTPLIKCFCQSFRCSNNAIPISGWNSSVKAGLSILSRSDLMPGCVWGRKSAAVWSRCAFHPIWRWSLLARPSIFAATVFRKRRRTWWFIPVSRTSLATGLFMPGNSIRTVKITHRPQGQWAFADSYMEAKAARLGLGLAYVPQELVADDLERGALIRVLQRYSQRLEGSFLYYPHRNVSPALRAVIDTLRI